MTQLPKYDLEERTAKFGEGIVVFVRTLKITPVNARIIEQVVGASGSIGANYYEATEAENKKDFIHTVGLCRKESKEAKHFYKDCPKFSC